MGFGREVAGSNPAPATKYGRPPRLVAYAQAADQHVWLAASAFVGAYAACAYASGAGGVGRKRPAPRVSHTTLGSARSGAYAFPVHAYAVALLKVLQGLGGVNLEFG